MSCIEAPPTERRIEEETEIIDYEDEEEEEEIEDDDDDVEEEEEEDEDHPEVTVGRRSGRGLTLKTLLKERVLEPGDGNMTINYLGNKFKGDLLPDGRIRSQETSKIFGTPSAWAIYCKKIVNPDKKSGCGWASVRYRGKKLDTYKNNWYRQKRLEYEKEEEEMEEESGCESEGTSPHEQEILEFDLLGNRTPNHDPATMIELGTFQAIGRMQPFNITMSSSAMAVIDVHAHLTTSEIVGYLAGQWDVNNHNLIVSHAFPVRCRLGDSDKGPSVEQELYAEMSRLKLSLVGWYHTHPHSPPLPTLRDIDSQLDYEMKMKGYNDASYTPVLGIIVSPYQKAAAVQDRGIPHPNGNATGFWVMPPPENKPLEYGRPMSMQFTVVQDAFIPKEALLHMSEVVKYYKDAPDSVELTDFFESKFTYWHKLRSSLRGRVPKDHFQPLIDFLTKVIDKKLPEDDPIPLLPPNPPAPSLPICNAAITTAVATITTAITASGSGTSITATPNLPPSTSISVAKESGNDVSSSTKDLESCVANILKCSMGADFVASSSESKERVEGVIISPAYSLNGSEKYGSGEEPLAAASSRPKSVEGRTPPPSLAPPPPPPKSYSPLFQLPLPPLFTLDSTTKLPKESQPLKPTYQPLNLQMEEKKYGEFSSPKSRSPSGKVEKVQMEDSPKIGVDMIAGTGASKYEMPSSSYLDLSKDKKTADEGKKEKESKLGAIDVPSWFAQAKLMQEAFAFPPHERENPFARSSSPATHREIPPLFPSEFLSHWNPSLKASYHPSLAFNASDSKPTYHSDVPLLLKKQQEESLKDTKMSQRDLGHDLKDFSRKGLEEHLLHREFRMPPPEYKDPKETKEQREAREGLKKKFRDVARDRLRDARNPFDDTLEFKEPMMKEHKDFSDERTFGESVSSSSRETKEEKLLHSIRDIQELNRREFRDTKETIFDDIQMQKDNKEPRDYRDMKDRRDISKEMEPKDLIRELNDIRALRDLVRDARGDPREMKEQKETKEPRESREMIETSDIERRELRDLRGEAVLREEIRELRKSFDPPPGDGKSDQREANSHLSDLGALRESGFSRSITPMDMTFKIKRDILNTDGGSRHFIEPSGIKRHQQPEPYISHGILESSRSIMDFLDVREPSRSNKEPAVINLTSRGSMKDPFEGSSLQHEFGKERMEGNYLLNRSSKMDPKELLVKVHDTRETSESNEQPAPMPKALINLRDPKTLFESMVDYRDTKDKLMEESGKHERGAGFPTTQRRLFPAEEDIEGVENFSAAAAGTPPIYIPHRASQVDEPMDFE